MHISEYHNLHPIEQEALRRGLRQLKVDLETIRNRSKRYWTSSYQKKLELVDKFLREINAAD